MNLEPPPYQIPQFETNWKNWLNRVHRAITGRRSGVANVADGGTVTHGFKTSPASVAATASTAGEMVSVTAIGASTFTVAIKKHDGTAGTTQDIYWTAELA